MTLGPVRLPLPPSANRMYRKGRHGTYADPDYCEWLNTANLIVRDAMMGLHGNMPTADTEKWWQVRMEFHVGKYRCDIDNYIKPIFDMLSGTVPDSGGKLVKTGLWWNDDRRVRCPMPDLITTHNADSDVRVMLTVTECLPPVNVQAETKRRERANRDLARDVAREVKAEARLAKKGGAK